jgi:glyceraldehyde 3-phosphate dehydrogenase
MTVRVGINGFGRVGRQILKAIIDNHEKELEVVAINDHFDAKQNAHLFKYDSNYGIYPARLKPLKKRLSSMVKNWPFTPKKIRAA